MKNIISIIMSILSSILLFIFGDIDFLFKVLFTVIILDFITGIIKAYINKNISSKKCLLGLIKKLGLLIIVSIASFLDRTLNLDNTIRDLTIYSFIFGEMISIIENWGLMGIKFPTILSSALEALKDKADDAQNKSK